VKGDHLSLPQFRCREQAHPLTFGEDQVFLPRLQRGGKEGAMALVIRSFVDQFEGAVQFKTQLFQDLAPRSGFRILPRLQMPAEDGPVAGPDDVRLIVPVLHQHAVAGVEQHAGDPDQRYFHATPTASPSDRR
jgi:hypothetical protein